MNEERLKKIKERLTSTFNPETLIVNDESRRHEGHPGNDGKGHFSIVIHSKVFENKSLLENHRLVYEALDDLMKTDIHSLKLSCEYP